MAFQQLLLGLGSKGASLALQKVQERVQDDSDGRSDLSENGNEITVEVSSSQTTQVEHKLGVKARWILVCKLGAGDVYDAQEADENFLYLDSSADITIVIKVFSAA